MMRQNSLPPHSLILKEILEPDIPSLYAFSWCVFTSYKREPQHQCCVSASPGTTGGTENPPGKGRHWQHSSSDWRSQQKMNSNGVVPKKPTTKIHGKKNPVGQLELFKPLQYSASLGGAKTLHSTICFLVP